MSEQRMSRAQAESIVGSILRHELPLALADHFWESKQRHGLHLQDLFGVLRVHQIEGPPEWDEAHGNYRVCLIGRCLRGRPVRVVLGLNPDAPCRLITIMVIK